VFGDIAPPPAQRSRRTSSRGPTTSRPLSAKNVGVTFLANTADLLRAAGIPAVAFLTPTNHALLHDFIDNRQYNDNERFMNQLLRSHAGQRRLALPLAAALRR
jgi:hypothetical protein